MLSDFFHIYFTHSVNFFANVICVGVINSQRFYQLRVAAFCRLYKITFLINMEQMHAQGCSNS